MRVVTQFDGESLGLRRNGTPSYAEGVIVSAGVSPTGLVDVRLDCGPTVIRHRNRVVPLDHAARVFLGLQPWHEHNNAAMQWEVCRRDGSVVAYVEDARERALLLAVHEMEDLLRTLSRGGKVDQIIHNARALLETIPEEKPGPR